MTRTLQESRVIRDLSEALCRGIARRAIRSLQALKDCRLSGDDSSLRNAWEEICVQVQDEVSVYWDAYETTMDQFIRPEVEQLADYEREAIWLQTSQGEDWDEEDWDQRESYPVSVEDIIPYIRTKYIQSPAEDWTNRRIRQYLQG